MKPVSLAAASALALLLPCAPAEARTPEQAQAQAQAIVAQFNRVCGGEFTEEELAKLLSDDFIEHHPTSGAPERTKAEFIAHFGRGPATPARKPGLGMPAPTAVVATGDEVVFMSRRELARPTTRRTSTRRSPSTSTGSIPPGALPSIGTAGRWPTSGHRP